MKHALALALAAAAAAPAGTWQWLGPDGKLSCLLADPDTGFPAWGSNYCLYLEDGSHVDGTSPSSLVDDAQAASSQLWFACGDTG